MDRDRMLAELLNASGGRCARCGRPLQIGNAVIEHIFPWRYGGSDRIDNLRVVCRSCNRRGRGRPFPRKEEFLQYLQKTLCGDGRFGTVEIGKQLPAADGQMIAFDIVFTRTEDARQTLYIVEAKAPPAVTDEKIDGTLRQMEHYRRAVPEAKYILAVPTVLAEEYSRRIHAMDIALWDRETLRKGIPDRALPVLAAPDRYDELICRLKACPAGRENWQVYQKLVGEVLAALFCPPLDDVSEQNMDADRANRRDFVLPNYADRGYWPYLRARYKAEYIVVDAKNAGEGIGKDDVLQVANYLKEDGPGMFGLIFTRRSVSENVEVHLRSQWQSSKKMLIVLDDSDVEQMLLSRQGGGDPCKLIITKIQEFRLRV